MQKEITDDTSLEYWPWMEEIKEKNKRADRRKRKLRKKHDD